MACHDGGILTIPAVNNAQDAKSNELIKQVLENLRQNTKAQNGTSPAGKQTPGLDDVNGN